MNNKQGTKGAPRSKVRRAVTHSVSKNLNACMERFESLSLTSSNIVMVCPNPDMDTETSKAEAREDHSLFQTFSQLDSISKLAQGTGIFASTDMPVFQSQSCCDNRVNRVDQTVFSSEVLQGKKVRDLEDPRLLSSGLRFKSYSTSFSLSTVHENPIASTSDAIMSHSENPLNVEFGSKIIFDNSRKFELPLEEVNLKFLRSRRKQLSHALLRGLWRWKEGMQAKKKRRKHKGRQREGSSGGSSDPKAPPTYASDPTCASEPFTLSASASCGLPSDVYLTGTSSSGELYSSSGGKKGETQRKVQTEGYLSSESGGKGTKSIGFDLEEEILRFMVEPSGVDSGYGSELGYGGDGELGYDDWADQTQDEEDLEICTGNRGGGIGGKSESVKKGQRESQGIRIQGLGFKKEMKKSTADDEKIWKSMMKRLSTVRAQSSGLGEISQNPDEDVVSELLTFDEGRIRKLHKKMRRRRRQLASLNRPSFGVSGPSPKPSSSGGQLWEEWFQNKGKGGKKGNRLGLLEGGHGSGYEEEDLDYEEFQQRILEGSEPKDSQFTVEFQGKMA